VNETTDAQLVAAARSGNVGSFGKLFERHYVAMVGAAYALLADGHLAEDAAQEAFAIACRDLGRLKRPERFASWLRAICRNVARGIARSRMVVSAAENAPAQASDDNEDEMDEAVRQAVARLRVSAREVVVLHYFSGMSHKQIATVLGISPQAVHGRLIRARRKIAEYLRRTGLNQRPV